MHICTSGGFNIHEAKNTTRDDGIEIRAILECIKYLRKLGAVAGNSRDNALVTESQLIRWALMKI